MAPQSPALPSLAWPAEDRRDAPWRRLGLPFFILLSLVVHGLSLQLKFQFWPKFPVDRENHPFRVELKAERAKTGLQAAPTTSPLPAAARPIGRSPSPVLSSTAPPSAALTLRQPATAEPATDLVERAKADIRASSQRQMLDPMFAPVVRHSPAKTPLERAAAIGEAKMEELGPSLFRITRADGSRYCLQRLPETVTRDIPVPVAAVPIQCQ